MGLPSGSVINNLLAMQKTQEAGVPSLGWEDPLQKNGIATYSSTFTWKISWTEEAAVQRVTKSWSGLKRLSMHIHTYTHTHYHATSSIPICR